MRKKSKTPFEIDDDFRRQISAVIAAPDYRKAAADKFLTPLFAKTLLIVVFIAVFAGFFVFIFGFTARYTAAYDCTVETVKNNQQIVVCSGRR